MQPSETDSTQGPQEHLRHKQLVAAFLSELADAREADVERTIRKFCHAEAIWEIFHPFNTIRGCAEVGAKFFAPLKQSFPDYEQRPFFVIAGAYEQRAWVSTLGHVMGTFAASWLGIPPTHALSFLRFGLHATMRDSKIEKAYIFLDIVDLMRQAGLYPFRKMPGTAEQWPGPPCSSGADIHSHDGELGTRTLEIVREMQVGGGKMDLKNLAKAKHSPHWHRDMNWYGPAGIGSTRGERGFVDYHGALFIQAFPDRRGIVRDHEGPQDGPGHFIRIGDGRFAVTGGWPSLYGTHLGGGWLGLAPSGSAVEMRVADWYRTDANNLLIDNWVMIDIPHIVHQFGLDLLDDMRYIVDPSLPRWPR